MQIVRFNFYASRLLITGVFLLVICAEANAQVGSNASLRFVPPSFGTEARSVLAPLPSVPFANPLRETQSPPILPNGQNSANGFVAVPKARPLSSADGVLVLPTYQEPTKEFIALLGVASEHEKYGRWSDAIALYESEIRKQSNNPVLLNRYHTARFHFDISRRYNDKTFLATVSEISLFDSLELFRDVSTKVISYHVDSHSWDQLFRFGIDDFLISLTESPFLSKNEVAQNNEAITRFSEKVRQTASGWTVESWTDMRNGVLYIAEMAQNEIGVRPTAVVLEFCCGAANALDPISSFLTLGQLNDQNATIEGNYVGIGIFLKTEAEPILIGKVISGTPAAQAGLRAGDKILSVDGKDVRGLGLDRAADMLQGPVGSVAQLNVLRIDGTSRIFSVTRRQIHVPSVEDVQMLDSKVGYAKLTCFQTKTKDELESALWELNRKGMQTFVLDLRQNPGGLLPVSVEVADLFVEEGTIVRTRTREHTELPWNATKTGTWKVPLIVLIDGESASAAEIFAGAMRDHKRALIIGERSYGKGTVQAIYKLNVGGNSSPIAGLKLTIEKFYSPNGIPYNSVGVSPDFAPDAELVSNNRPPMPPVRNDAKTVVARPIVNSQSFILSLNNDPCVAKALEIARSRHSTQ